MIVTDTFASFARRLAATTGCPYVSIAETPNPIRQLDETTTRQRAEGMIDAIIQGLTQSPEAIRRRLQEVAPQQIHPPGVVRAGRPV